MPVYPGTDKPEISDPFTVTKDGFAEKRLNMLTHTGTHIDAPAHMIGGAKTLDMFPLSKFTGLATVVDLQCEPGSLIELSHLESRKSEISKCDYVLLNTGWSHFWGEDRYFDYPVLTEEAARWLAEFDLNGIGFDVISVDPVGSTGMTNHHIILGKERIIVENLTNLENIGADLFQFFCLPLNVEDADGSPVRAFALTGD